MSNQAQTAVNAAQAGAPGWFASIDYLLTSAQRAAEGVINYNVLNSEAKAKAAQARWAQAAYDQLYSQQTGGAGSNWSGIGGVGGIQLPGINQAGMGGAMGLVVPIGIGLALAYAFFKE